MPLKPNEASRLRGMIARLITTKDGLSVVCRDHRNADQGYKLRFATVEYYKAREKLNKYIDKLEEKTCPPSE